jgi:hypothetical protein
MKVITNKHALVGGASLAESVVTATEGVPQGVFSGCGWRREQGANADSLANAWVVAQKIPVQVFPVD